MCNPNCNYIPIISDDDWSLVSIVPSVSKMNDDNDFMAPKAIILNNPSVSKILSPIEITNPKKEDLITQKEIKLQVKPHNNKSTPIKGFKS